MAPWYIWFCWCNKSSGRTLLSPDAVHPSHIWHTLSSLPEDFSRWECHEETHEMISTPFYLNARRFCFQIIIMVITRLLALLLHSGKGSSSSGSSLCSNWGGLDRIRYQIIFWSWRWWSRCWSPSPSPTTEHDDWLWSDIIRATYHDNNDIFQKRGHARASARRSFQLLEKILQPVLKLYKVILIIIIVMINGHSYDEQL